MQSHHDALLTRTVHAAQVSTVFVAHLVGKNIVIVGLDLDSSAELDRAIWIGRIEHQERGLGTCTQVLDLLPRRIQREAHVAVSVVEQEPQGSDLRQAIGADGCEHTDWRVQQRTMRGGNRRHEFSSLQRIESRRTASRTFRVLHRLTVILSLRRIRDPSARRDELRILRLRSQARSAQDDTALRERGRPGPGLASVAKREDSYGPKSGPKAGSRASSPGEQAAACDYQRTRALGRGLNSSPQLATT